MARIRCDKWGTIKADLEDDWNEEHYARIFLQLKRAGTPVPDNDLWIASLAVEHDLTLITSDRHFERIAQLPCESE